MANVMHSTSDRPRFSLLLRLLFVGCAILAIFALTATNEGNPTPMGHFWGKFHFRYALAIILWGGITLIRFWVESRE